MPKTGFLHSLFAYWKSQLKVSLSQNLSLIEIGLRAKPIFPFLLSFVNLLPTAPKDKKSNGLYSSDNLQSPFLNLLLFQV